MENNSLPAPTKNRRKLFMIAGLVILIIIIALLAIKFSKKQVFITKDVIAPTPVWFNKSNKLAYLSDKGNKVSVIIVDFKLPHLYKKTTLNLDLQTNSGDFNPYQISISPDDKSMAIATKNGVYLVDLSNTTINLIVNSRSGHTEWLDENTFLYTQLDGIYRQDLNRQKTEKLITSDMDSHSPYHKEPTLSQDLTFRVSPNKKFIAYTSVEKSLSTFGLPYQISLKIYDFGQKGTKNIDTRPMVSFWSPYSPFWDQSSEILYYLKDKRKLSLVASSQSQPGLFSYNINSENSRELIPDNLPEFWDWGAIKWYDKNQMIILGTSYLYNIKTNKLKFIEEFTKGRLRLGPPSNFSISYDQKLFFIYAFAFDGEHAHKLSVQFTTHQFTTQLKNW